MGQCSLPQGNTRGTLFFFLKCANEPLQHCYSSAEQLTHAKCWRVSPQAELQAFSSIHVLTLQIRLSRLLSIACESKAGLSYQETLLYVCVDVPCVDVDVRVLCGYVCVQCGYVDVSCVYVCCVSRVVCVYVYPKWAAFLSRFIIWGTSLTLLNTFLKWAWCYW